MIKIREAVVTDVEEIWALGEHVEEFHTSNQAPNFWPKVVLKASIGKREVMILVAIHDGKIVGFIIANCNLPLSKVLIENIFVRPGVRRQGIGTQLVQEVLRRAKTDGFQFVSVLTPPSDVSAIKTYEKVGFTAGETFLWLDFNSAA
jgi:ribosomal protein S18 acetylase RimI-like enzyme